jgi:hypothetical protein
MKLPEITPKIFYMVGKYAFGANALIGLIRVVDLWSSLKSYEIFSSLASTTFYFILAGFFASMQKKEDIAELNDSDIFKMNDALDKLNLDGGKTNAKDKQILPQEKRRRS